MTPILKSKLCFSVKPESIHRCCSRSLGKAILKNRLTTITAGAGYGKTTLAAQALERVDARIIWIEMDRPDWDLDRFLNCLHKGGVKIYPDLDGRQHGWSDLKAKENDFRQFLGKLEGRLDKDLVLVLDDFHWVMESEGIKAFLNFFLRHGDSSFHLVLISRASLPLPLSRLKARGQLLEVGSGDLAFSCDETALLFKEKLQTGWDQDIIDRIWKLSQGWASGLTLFHYGLQDLGIDDVRNCLDRSDFLPDPVADYIEEEVFSPLAPEIRDFLVRTSILTGLDPQFCDEFLGSDRSRRILNHLASFHVFIQQKPGGVYEYHNVLGLFLFKKLTALFSSQTIAGLHGKAAGLYEARQMAEKALEHFLAGTDFQSVVRLVNIHGRRLFQEEKFDVLKICLDAVPSSCMDDFPWVLCLYGKLQGIFAGHEGAVDAYGRALGKFAQQNNDQGVNLCRIEIALNFCLAGQFYRAAQVLDELLSRPAIDNELRIEALGYLTFLAAQLRHRRSGHQWLKTCRSAMASLDRLTLTSHQKAWLDIIQGHAFLATGDIERALELGRAVEWRIEQQEELSDFYGHYALLANACNSLHRFKKGMDYARKGLAGLARKEPVAFSLPVWQPAGLTPAGTRDRGRQDTTLPFLLIQAARSAFGLGQSEQSITYALESVDLFRSMGARWGQALGLNTLCTAYARKGDLVLARESALAGLSLVKGLDLPMTRGTLTGNLAAILMMAGRHEEALPLIRDAQKEFEPFGLNHWTDLWLARYHWHKNQARGREAFLSVLSSRAKTKTYEFVAERHWIVPFLVEIYAQGKFRDYIFNFLEKIGSDAVLDLKQILRDSPGASAKETAALKSAASGLLSKLPRPDPPGLKICLLGRFRAFVGDREIRPGQWGSQKVRSLFQYLAFSRFQGYVNRDVLVEMLWPDQDPGKTLNRFHVAMTALRRVLEPDLPDGAPSSYISRVQNAYRLLLGSRGDMDMDVFRDAMTRAEKSKYPEQAFRHSMEAVFAYKGDLLAEVPFWEWCSRTRQNLRNQYLQALKIIIAYHEQQKNFEQCIVYTEKYLCADGTAEKMYRNLMGFYAATGNLVQVASVLKRCKESLRLELDCPVEPKTEALAQRLLTRETARTSLRPARV